MTPPDYTGGFDRADIEGLLDMMDKNYMGWASFLAPVIMKNAERPELGAELEESFCSTDPQIARRFAEATFYSDNRADLPNAENAFADYSGDGRRGRARFGRRIYAPKFAGQHSAFDGRERSLPAYEPPAGNHRDYQGLSEPELMFASRWMNY